MDRALEGVKVAEFTFAAAGPLIGKYLADFGATVVKVESWARPDPTRTSAPFKGGVHVDHSGYFCYYNANKYSINLNLDHPKGIEIARKLVSWADVVIENFTPGTMEKFGLDYENLRKIKPDIIMLRSSNLGQTGPHARLPGTGNHLVGLAGFVHLTGWPDRDPVQPYGAYPDFISPRLATAAVIAALDYRRRTGKGQYLDISQCEAALHFLVPAILDYTVNARDMNRAGNSCPYAAPHGVYRCRGEDKWCAIAVFSDIEWKAFTQVVGAPQWAEDPRFATLLGRKENEEELDMLVEGWTANFIPEDVMERMQTAGVAAGVVENIADLYNAPQLRERNHLWLLQHREMGAVSHLGQSVKLSKTPAQARLPAPCLGEHTEYVMSQMLGMTSEEFVELVNEKVL